MAQLGIAFDANEVDPSTVVPEGVYPMMAVSSEVGTPNSGQGTKLSFQFKIIDGPHKGRVIFFNFNTSNPSETAQRIGQAQFSQFCRAAGVMQVQDTTQLHDRPFNGKVIVSIDKSGQYPDSNDIRAFEPLAAPGAPMAATGQAPVTGAPAQPQSFPGTQQQAAQPQQTAPVQQATQPPAAQPVPAQAPASSLAPAPAGQPGPWQSA